MRVLGIDPGLTRCGVGVVEGVPGRQCKLIAYYVIYTDTDDDISLRLLRLDTELAKLVAEHQPGSVAVERVDSVVAAQHGQAVSIDHVAGGRGHREVTTAVDQSQMP